MVVSADGGGHPLMYQAKATATASSVTAGAGAGGGGASANSGAASRMQSAGDVGTTGFLGSLNIPADYTPPKRCARA